MKHDANMIGIDAINEFILRYIEACETLRRVLEWAPHLEDLWLMAADIYAGSDDMDSARQVSLFFLLVCVCKGLQAKVRERIRS